MRLHACNKFVLYLGLYEEYESLGVNIRTGRLVSVSVFCSCSGLATCLVM